MQTSFSLKQLRAVAWQQLLLAGEDRQSAGRTDSGQCVFSKEAQKKKMKQTINSNGVLDVGSPRTAISSLARGGKFLARAGHFVTRTANSAKRRREFGDVSRPFVMSLKSVRWVFLPPSQRVEEKTIVSISTCFLLYQAGFSVIEPLT